MHDLILIRHGESAWNNLNKFTGWTDVDLSDLGVQEAIECGLMLNGKYKFDIAYTSVLKRSISTCWRVLENSGNLCTPVHHTWRLNERHYGALQGLNKSETANKYGEDQVKIWRRSYDTPPPPLSTNDAQWPGNDPLYADVPKQILPLNESLKDTVERVIPFWYDTIAKNLLDNKKVIIVAHGNSLRALYKHIKKVSDNDIVDFNIPTGIPLIMTLDANLNYLSDHFLIDEKELKKKMDLVASQGKVK